MNLTVAIIYFVVVSCVFISRHGTPPSQNREPSTWGPILMVIGFLAISMGLGFAAGWEVAR